jgi:4-amino-4-deoxy-L-arabinose transferase-like glycosyltransferase
MLTYFSRLTPYQRWRYAFWGMLIFRLMLPVYYGPMDHFYSDMVRHWNNGIDLFNPPLWGAIDSKLYQVYMAVLIRLGGQAEAPIHLYSGVLCAALPYVWYRAIRELYGKNTSLKLGLCIGLCPSFLVIYEYFMTETLLLVMLGLSVWQTLRAVRIKTRRAIVLAGVINALTCYTRLIALPVSLALTVYLWSVTPCKKALMRSALGVFGLLYVIFGLHSLKVIDRFSALGYPSINAFYHFSGAQSFEMILTNERYIFSSPSFHIYVLPQKGIRKTVHRQR